MNTVRGASEACDQAVCRASMDTARHDSAESSGFLFIYFCFFPAAFFANFAASRFFVFLEREVLFFPTPVARFAIWELYTNNYLKTIYFKVQPCTLSVLPENSLT